MSNNTTIQKNTTRFVINNKDIGTNEIARSVFRKCVHHIHSYSYAENVREFDSILTSASNESVDINMTDTINVKIAFHFLAPRGSYNKNRVSSRVHDIVASMNDDFNNYTSNQNTMNNFKYKSIINQVFFSNQAKQRAYLAADYIGSIPKEPSNITFEIGDIYYYPIRTKLNLSKYDDITEVELEQQAIKSYIHTNRADAIEPNKFLNIWIIDMSDTSILGFSSFPWERIDGYHGIVINRRCFFPEDFGDGNYNLFKTLTHQVGHYFGLLHTDHTDSRHGMGAYLAHNFHLDMNDPDSGDYIDDTPTELTAVIDPTDLTSNKELHTQSEYNPLFMNFMDGTIDKFVCMFTVKQIKNMRYFINKYRSNINYTIHNSSLPAPLYNPDTDTTAGIINSVRQIKTTSLPNSDAIRVKTEQISVSQQTNFLSTNLNTTGITLDPETSLPYPSDPIYSEYINNMQNIGTNQNIIQENTTNMVDNIDANTRTIPTDRIYTKYAESKSATGLNTLDSKYKPEPSNLQEVNRDKSKKMTALPRHLEKKSDLIERQVDRQIENQIERPTDRTQNQPMNQPIAFSTNTKPLSATDQSVRNKLDMLRKIPKDKDRFDQYGRIITENVTNRKVRQIEQPQIMKKFTRTKPSNMSPLTNPS